MDEATVLIIGSVKEVSGNKSTAKRIRSYFKNCFVKDVSKFVDQGELASFIQSNKITHVLGIHALRSGRLLQDGCSVPYAILFGGTDINEFSKVKSNRDIMTSAISHASCLVAFTETMFRNAHKIFPHINEKPMLIIPQAVVTTNKIHSSVISWKEEYGLPSNSLVFVLVAGLRSVKDPLYLVDAFEDWHKAINRSVFLVVIGPQLDDDYSSQFQTRIKRLSSVRYLGSMTMQDTQHAIASSFALVNSSISEGMSTSILEAMDLGIPVIARDNEGNSDLVQDMHNGLLYHTPTDFVTKAELLIADTNLRNTMIQNARTKIAEIHDCQREKDSYHELVKGLCREHTLNGLHVV